MFYTLKCKAYRGHYDIDSGNIMEQHGCTEITVNLNNIKYIYNYEKNEGTILYFGSNDYILLPNSDKESKTDLEKIKKLINI